MYIYHDIKSFNLFVLQVLLVSSRSEPERWTVAGGGIEPNETGADTSVREAKEEVSGERGEGGREGGREG